ncbi:MAG: hypothetical protein IJW58_04585 [Clostridia bacterium]|nr:hypothetical protein [Clostridia bacterium]
MEREEIEKKLQEKANETKIPDFESVWEKIEPRITEQKKEPTRWRKFIRPLAVTFACVAITCGIVLPIVLQKPPVDPPPVYYLNDDLTSVSTVESELLNALQNSTIQVVDLSRFKLDRCFILKTDNGIVKGGRADFLDNQENPTCLIQLKFYDKDVQVSDNHYENLESSYVTQSGAIIEYKHESAFNKFYIKAEYKTVQYFMEYMGATETVTQFFETFFL